MRRPLLLAASAFALAAAPGPAGAHSGNPDFESVVRSVDPRAPGLQVGILGGDDRLEVVNGTGRTVTLYGYDGEPYARILGNGTVQVNRASPASYLNEDRYLEGVDVPLGVTGRGRARWTEVDRTGRFTFHVHRIHYMSKGTPPIVEDTSKATTVFDWAIPIAVGSTKGAVRGRLSWRPLDDGGPPAGAIAALVALVLVGGAAVVLVRRRRRGAEDPGAPGTAREAW